MPIPNAVMEPNHPKLPVSANAGPVETDDDDDEDDDAASTRKMDEEILAISQILRSLGKMPESARTRILTYLCSRFAEK
jgi:hypothetical protein